MNKKAAEARRIYRRKWQQDNKDKVREYQERYWTKKAQEMEKKQQEAEEAEAQEVYI